MCASLGAFNPQGVVKAKARLTVSRGRIRSSSLARRRTPGTSSTGPRFGAARADVPRAYTLGPERW
jgi:ribosomal protein L19E